MSSQQDIDQFIQSEVIDINGKLFISRDKAKDMIVGFAKQQIENETAALRQKLQDADKSLETSERINVKHIGYIEELEKELEDVKQNDKARKNAIDNHWEPFVKQQNIKIETLEREKDIAIKTCDRLAEEKIMMKEEITDLDKKNKDWEEQNSILIKADVEQVTEIQQLNALVTKHRDFLAQIFNAIEHEENIDKQHFIYPELITFLEHK